MYENITLYIRQKLVSLDNSAVSSYIGMARLRGGCFFSVIYGVTISTLSFHSVNEEGNVDIFFSSTRTASALMMNVCLICPECHFKEILRASFFSVQINGTPPGHPLGKLSVVSITGQGVTLNGVENGLFLVTLWNQELTKGA